MTAEERPGAHDGRSDPRASAQIQVDVDVSGSMQSVVLTTRDIGTGGVFLRTAEPAALWKRVTITISSPGGKQLIVAGEVVRRLTAEQAKAKNYPPGMAVAFDEMSRGKHQELAQLVTELAALEAQQAQKPEAKPEAKPETKPKPQLEAPPPQAEPKTPDNPAAATPAKKPEAKTGSVESKADKLLEELDALLSMDD